MPRPCWATSRTCSCNPAVGGVKLRVKAVLSGAPSHSDVHRLRHLVLLMLMLMLRPPLVACCQVPG